MKVASDSRGHFFCIVFINSYNLWAQIFRNYIETFYCGKAGFYRFEPPLTGKNKENMIGPTIALSHLIIAFFW